MKLKVSDKHIILRVILTAIFFVIAVVAFTVGVTNIGKKTSGYQLIEGKTDAEALTYNNSVHFKYWFEGSSNQIKRGIRDLEAEYTPILSAAYKQLDHQNTYTAQVGIGNINQSLGQEVKLSSELYAILQDAYAKTIEKKGFNMFAGALYDAWHSILILEDPEEFDPLNSEFQAQRLSAIAEVVNNLDNFKLEFLPDNTVVFSVSDEYQAFCAQYEIDAYALDLNVLKDAYMLQWIGSSLVEKGFRYGYLFTEEGTVLNLSDRGSLDYGMYTLERDSKGSLVEKAYATITLDGVFSASTLTAWGMGSDYGYTMETEGRTVLRSQNFDVATGEQTDTVLSLTVIESDLDLVDAVYKAIQINNLDSAKDVEVSAKELESHGTLVSYILQNVL